MAKLLVEFDGKNAKRQAAELEDTLRRLGITATKATGEVRQLGAADTYVRDLGSGIKANLLAPLGAAAIAAGAVALAIGSIRGAIGLLSSAVTSAAEAERVIAGLRAGVESTGASAGYTADQLSSMASEFEKTTRFSDETVASAERLMLAFKNVKGDTFREAIAGATDLSTALGTDLTQAAMMLGKALDNPAEGLTALGRAGVKFYADEQKVLDQMVETGRAAEAQGIILDRVSAKFGGSASADLATYSGSLSHLNNVWDNFLEVVGGQVLPIFMNLFNQLSNLIDTNGETGRSIAELIEYAVRFSLVLASVATTVVELSLDLGSRLVRAQAAVADGFAAITFGETSAAFKEAANDARGNAEAMELIAEVAGNAAVALMKTAVGIGETASQSSALKGELRELTPEELAAAAAAERLEAAQKAAAAAAKEFGEKLQSIQDEVNPAGASIRNLFEKLDVLKVAFDTGKISLSEYNYLVDQLTKSTTAATDALFNEATGLFRVQRQQIELIPNPGAMDQGTITIEARANTTQYEDDVKSANDQLAANLEQSFSGAFASAIMEFATGGEDALEHLGDAMLQSLLSAVEQWLAAQLAAIAKAAFASKAIGGSTGGGGVGGMVGPAMSNGAFTSGAGGGAMSGMGTFVAVLAVMAGIVAIFKHQSDRANAVRYDTTAGAQANNGIIESGFVGRLGETGTKVSQAIAGLLSAFQSATGSFIQGTASAEIQIRNDKERFRAVVNGVLVGEFSDINEAIIAAAKTAFLNADLSSVIDPAIAQVINNFNGSDPQKLVEAINSIRGIVDEVSGLTEIEIALRDLPQKAAAVASQLVAMGVSFEDAERLAGQWQATQMQNLRDQITGHQQTAAEELAERQRQAAMFNAQLAIMKAETEIKRQDIAVRIAALEASGQIMEGLVEINNAELRAQSLYLQGKNELYNQDVQIQEWYLNTMGAASNASLMTLRAQLEAFDALLANLPTAIDIGEIRVNRPRGGGGGGPVQNVDTGPTEAEQRIESFLAFLENARLAGLSGYQRALFELNRSFAEQRATLDEMRAASDGSAESLAELAGYEADLAAARAQAAADLREEVIDGFNLPLEGVRDRISEINQRVQDWYASGQELVDQYQRGEIGMDQLMAALEEANNLWAEFGQSIRSELLNLALYFTDALGDTEASAAMRAELAEMEWDFRRAELRMLLEAYHAVHAIDDEQYQQWIEFLDALPENRPPAPEPPPPPRPDPTPPPPDTTVEDAMRDLIAALQDLADLQRDLWSDSNLSPLNSQQQAEFLGSQLQSAYEAAMASGSAEDVQNFQNLIRDYLESYQAAYGSTGNYSAEFLRVNEMINQLLALGGISGIPGSTLGTTPGAGTGSDGWRPTPGGGGSVPFALERTGGPASPLVVEAPGVTARLEIMNSKLDALERRLAGIETETYAGNLQAASREFRARSYANEVGFSGSKNIDSRRGA